jgi:hypothetical protein
VTVLRKRDKQIAFRVSEDEYRALQIACLETGSRSISDLARQAAKNVAATGSLAPFGSRTERSASSLNGRVGKVEEVLELLTQDLRQIKQRLGVSAEVA